MIIKKCGVLLLSFIGMTAYAQHDLKLQYDQPANYWTEALPVGNGRLGAMVFGKPNEELIQLNEATLWSGGPVAKNINPTAFENLKPIRAALMAGDYAKAYELTKNMQGNYSESYLPLGDLLLKQDFGNATPAAYHRELNLANGVSTTTFSVNGVTYKREIFASAPGECIIIRLTASEAKKLSFSVAANSQLKNQVAVANQSLSLKGKAPSHVTPSYISYDADPIVYTDDTGCKGMRFELVVKPVVEDGTVSANGNNLVIKDASEVVLLVSAATSFNGFDKCPDSDGKDEHQLVLDHLAKASGKTYSTLLNEHRADFEKFFNRVSITLNKGEKDKSSLTTDKRLEAYSAGEKDSGLEELFFQYGRYLLISSSRTKDAPANLQGIWNHHLRAPWSSNYTTNINVQMNYWPVESANLSELFSPLNDLIHNLSVTGKETAKSYYHANGWITHHNSDIWAMSNPVGDFGKGDPMWANWWMGANWLSRHLWEHYQYTGDEKYLAEVYPILKGAAEFSLDWLQKDKDGYLVTMPSTSPENEYYYDGKKKGIITVASTMDMSIIKDLFSNTIAASKALGADKEFRKKLEDTYKKMYPFHIGSKGQLQEWYKDFEDVDPHHRHTSHLYSLHPATLITPFSTPDLANAARKTLELRGDDGTGWSLAWKVNMWARLLDGDHAYKIFRNQLRLTREGGSGYKGGGSYPNLFDAHPPFQIDGNFAGTAGIIEMLMQSQNNEIHLLPALPAAWKSGEIKGIVAKGNFTVNIDWKDGKLVTAGVVSNIGGSCTIRANEPFKVEGVKAKAKKTAIGYTITFETKKGGTYKVQSL